MRSINVFVVAYAFIFILSLLIISLNCEDLVTCFTSVATTLTTSARVFRCAARPATSTFPAAEQVRAHLRYARRPSGAVPHASAVCAGNVEKKPIKTAAKRIPFSGFCDVERPRIVPVLHRHTRIIAAEYVRDGVSDCSWVSIFLGNTMVLFLLT